MNESLWQAKLAAWTHDPAEKPLVLMHDPAGHEGGTVAALRQAIFGAKDLPKEIADAVKKADRLAAAADRPQWPRREEDGLYASWTRVTFTDNPVLIHPLSGEEYRLAKLDDIEAAAIKAVSTDHFKKLIVYEEDKTTVDARRTALAFWRFGPDKPAPDVGALWGLLPADTRVPDHTIWSHLDLSSALSSAFHADPNGHPALLSVSFGPVQDFIAQARTTSDLWAGSHLLSRIAWEGLKVVCEECGPDCVLFPQLRGIPLVDLWLRDEVGLCKALFTKEEWAVKNKTDANPLFAAALPNKFVAIVPAGFAKELAEKVTKTVRRWVRENANAALDYLVTKAGGNVKDLSAARQQIEQQFTDFPEVHWAAVPWSLTAERQGQAPDVSSLAKSLGHFYPKEHSEKPGFLDSDAWKLFSKELKLSDNTTFFHPNAGVLYPALYDLLDRLQAAAKSIREFKALPQEGYRCSLCGEREWLSDDRDLLQYSPRQQTKTLWAKVQGSSLARKGEHLCGPCTLKRLWPNVFMAQVAQAIGGKANRFVVSTHTLALATNLENWLNQYERPPLTPGFASQLEKLALEDTVALPRKLANWLWKAENAGDKDVRLMLRGLPLFLEKQKERLTSNDPQEREKGEQLQSVVESELKNKVFGQKPEAYYALIMMDGDSMGAWLSGTEDRYQLRYRETWHPQIRNAVAQKMAQANSSYPEQFRPVSPARHMAISSALNSFALHIARHIVEDIGKGKLIYAGGDDVLAMVSIDDLLQVMFLLRLAYGGVFPVENTDKAWEWLGGGSDRLDIGRGHIRFKDRLYRVMGHKATASMGAIVAHHQAPLGYVLRKLREAEKTAKEKGGRDAFTIELLKRSGGAVQFTCPWLPRDEQGHADWSQFSGANLEVTPMGQLIRLRNRFAGDGFSRRAAYLVEGWLEHMPSDPIAMETMLAYQFQRQSSKSDKQDKQVVATLGHSLAKLAQQVGHTPPDVFIRNCLAVAEFLAREGRVSKKKDVFRDAREDVA